MSTLLLLAATLVTAADATSDFMRWNAGLAYKQLDQREAEVRAVTTREQAEARKKIVRERLLSVLNGLPNYHGPLNAHVTGSLDMGGYRIEKLTYESLAGYVVTANLYLPKTAGKHPAVLYPIGHWDNGKAFGQILAANLALKDFVVLAYDPVGQGERLQAYDARLGRSLIGPSVSQHMLNGAASALIGDGVIRYWVADGMRGIDYLQSRPEVDADRIGCTGCSGGGTATSFISALDPRVKVAVPSCYIQSFRSLITGETGDSEQSNPRFIANGLDHADFIELFSPKPYLFTSTDKDFFTPANAKPTADEAKRWYGIYGAEDKFSWQIGPGEHGTPRVLREAICEWMLRWLGQQPGSTDLKARAAEVPIRILKDFDLQVTESGQLGAASKDLYQIIDERMRSRFSPDAGGLTAYLKRGMSESEPDMDLHSYLIPAEGKPTGNGVLLVESDQYQMSRIGKSLAEKGDTVLVVVPRGLPSSQGYPYSFEYAGPDWKNNVVALLVGRNLPLLRARDVIRGVDRLLETPGVQRISRAEAGSVAGYWLLAAAAVDPRIPEIHLYRTPWSIRAAFSQGLTRDLYQVAMYGFSLHWDTEDLLKAIAPRRIIWTDPTDWNRNVVNVKGEIYDYTQLMQ